MAMKISKISFCEKIAHSLRDFGYPDCTAEMVQDCMDSWIAGKRDLELPHGVIGAFVSRQLDEVEEVRPGVIASL